MSQPHPPQIRRIPIAEAPVFADLDRAIARRDASLQPFLPPALGPESLRQQIRETEKTYRNRAILADLLERQYAGLELPDRLAANLRDLSRQGTFCVVTAHQPLLFGGKNYFLYKALTAIRLAEWASGEANCKVVPVFVLGSEDHDHDEVSATHIFGETLIWASDTGGAVGRMPLGNIPDLIEGMEALLQGLPHRDEVLSLVRAAYTSERTFARATFHFLHALLGRKGLIVLDPDDREAKRCLIPVAREELMQQIARREVDPVLQALEKAGIKQQAAGRAINLFYLAQGLRARIESDTEGGFLALEAGMRWTMTEILHELETAPERFSPNVLLRPVYQQLLLPGLIFTGGGGELAYWMELGGLFRSLSLPFPLLARRDSAWLLDEGTLSRMDKLGLEDTDLMEDPELVIQRYVKAHTDISVDLTSARDAIAGILNPLREDCQRIDPTLARSFEAVETNMLKQLEVLETKMIRGLKHRHEQEVQQIRHLFARIFPAGSLQERHENFLPWIARYGMGWIDELEEAIDPLEPAMVIKRF
jgi:bacillithiol synthase